VGYNNREIELKLEVKNAKSIEDVSKRLEKIFNYTKSIKGKSKDVYWETGDNSKADFVRLRLYPDSSPQVTVKYTDKGTNFDRVEIDLNVDSAKNAVHLINSLFGKPKGSIVKEYQVYFLDEEDSNISVYKVKDDPRVFIEIEARTKKKVLDISKSVKKYSPELKTFLVGKSLFELFIEE
jgi:adenylate cyclase class IV